MAPVVSVIVPAYNAGPYIDECIASLLKQSVPLEIIVVNDGSTDDTPQRVKAIAPPSRHTLVLVEQGNLGLSGARNTGLRRATGDFVGFVDADDWVEPDTFSTMAEAVGRVGAEVAIFSGQMIDHNTHAAKPFQDQIRLSELAGRHAAAVNPRTVIDVFMLDTCACKRMYSRHFLQKVDFQFADGLLFEDVLAHFQLLMMSEKVLLLDRMFYNYRINHPGRITDRSDETVLTVFEVMRRSAETLSANGASAEIWARFVWFQNWVLRWLGSQVSVVHQDEFSRGIAFVARQLPTAGIVEFQRAFAADQVAQLTVTLQMLGWTSAFLNLARGTLSEDDQRTLAMATDLIGVASELGCRYGMNGAA
jgi:glycosyltransferase involved in cell wall biosynthesis